MPIMSSRSERNESVAGWNGILRDLDESVFEKKTSMDYLQSQNRFEQIMSSVDPFTIVCPTASPDVR